MPGHAEQASLALAQGLRRLKTHVQDLDVLVLSGRDDLLPRARDVCKVCPFRTAAVTLTKIWSGLDLVCSPVCAASVTTSEQLLMLISMQACTTADTPSVCANAKHSAETLASELPDWCDALAVLHADAEDFLTLFDSFIAHLKQAETGSDRTPSIDVPLCPDSDRATVLHGSTSASACKERDPDAPEQPFFAQSDINRPSLAAPAADPVSPDGTTLTASQLASASTYAAARRRSLRGEAPMALVSRRTPSARSDTSATQPHTQGVLFLCEIRTTVASQRKWRMPVCGQHRKCRVCKQLAAFLSRAHPSATDTAWL